LDDSSHLMNIIRIVFRWRKAAAVFFCAVVAAALIYCLVTPNEYTARATLMPGTTTGEMTPTQSMASSFINKFGFLGALRGSVMNPADIFANTLSSRLLARRVTEKHDLVRVFEVGDKDPDKALEQATDDLMKITSVDVSDKLLISIEVTYEDPVLAAAIANSFLDELDKANQEFSLSSAKKAREFVEGRLEQSEKALVSAQAAFTQFQEEHGAVVLDEQSKATVGAVARLEGEILAQEAQRDALMASHTPSFSKVRDLELSIQALRDKVRSLMKGTKGDERGGEETLTPEEGVFIPLGEVPAISAQYARLLLDVKTQEKVLEILVEQHEQLKIEEAKNVPTIQVLDRAFPPTKKSKPMRTVTMILAGLVGLVGAIGLALVLNYLEGEFDQPKLMELSGMRKRAFEELASGARRLRRSRSGGESGGGDVGGGTGETGAGEDGGPEKGGVA
jgi:tyrosine-protein kinase Etk/Wzc